MRGTFANIRLKNIAATATTCRFARHVPSGDVVPLYDVAIRYADEDTPLVFIGGKEYSTGSSLDWAAKGKCLLGIKAMVAASFERIHRSNLIGMGILLLQFPHVAGRENLGLYCTESLTLIGIANGVTAGMDVQATITKADGLCHEIMLLIRIDADDEATYFKSGVILHYVLRQLAAA